MRKLNSILVFILILSSYVVAAETSNVKLTYIPNVIQINKSTTMTQKELDEALVKLFKKSPMKDQYNKATDLLSKGAFVTKNALYYTIKKQVKDYRAFQLLYVNGGFDKDVLQNCSLIKKAVKVDYLASYQSLENEINSSVQTALFLKDKVDFSKCDVYSALAGTEYNSNISLETLKVVVQSQKMASKILNDLVVTIFNNKDVKWQYKKRAVHSYFKPRIKAIKLLQNRGGVVSNKSIAKYLDLYRNPIPYTKHQNIALKYYEEILKLISKDIKNIDKTIDNALREMKEMSNSKSSKPVIKNMYKIAIKILSKESNTNIKEKQANDDMLTQLRTAILKKDKRRIDFYLRRGAKPTSGIFYLTIQNGLEELFFKLLKINTPKDLDYNKLLYTSAVKKTYKVLDFIIKNKPINNNLEDTIIVLLSDAQNSRAQKLINKNINVNKIIDSVYFNYGLNSKELSNAVELLGKEALSRYKYFKNIETQKNKKRIKEEKEREKKRIKQLKQEQEEYSKIKKVGDKVCLLGTQLLFFEVEIKGYVENVVNDKIQIRISDTGAYSGNEYIENRLVWEPYWNWKICR
ncbi:hypothetical protein ACH5BK_11955 [Arcobacter sp. YIC-80]|uniref:hypothetical protein n=1 Tax=Arcobacter sp. YIC-80 TaxID=3376683 RepID=UPI00384E2177